MTQKYKHTQIVVVIVVVVVVVVVHKYHTKGTRFERRPRKRNVREYVGKLWNTPTVKDRSLRQN